MSPERTIGESIRQARDARGMSLEDVSRETRLSLAVLRNLETDHFADLSGDLYIQNALRMLAECLGLDRMELLARYRDGQGTSGSAGGTAGAAEGVWREEGVPETRVEGLRPGRRAWLFLFGMLFLALLAWLIASGRLGLPERGDGAEPGAGVQEATRVSTTAQVAPETQEPPQPTPDPMPAAPLQAAADPGSAASTWSEGPVLPAGTVRSTTLRRTAALELSIVAVADCRLQVNVDGRRHLVRGLAAGERWTLRAGEFIVLSADDAGAIALELDGEPYPLPTALPAGRPLALRIDPQGQAGASRDPD